MQNHSKLPSVRSVPLRDSLWRVCWRHKGKIVLLPVASIGLGLAIILFYPRTYQSEAKLFLQVGRETVGLDPTATTGQTISLMQSGREDEVKSAIELLSGRTVIAKVVERLSPEFVLGETGPGAEGPGNAVTDALKQVVGTAVRDVQDIDPLPPAEEAIVKVERSLRASAERGSTVIVCRYEADAPELAQAVLEALIAEYRAEHLRVHRNQDSLEFFVKQQDELRHALDQATAVLRDAKNQHGLASIAGRRSSLEQQLHRIESEQLQAEQDLAANAARIAELERILSAEPERVLASQRIVPNNGADLMRDQLYALRVREKELSSRFSGDHPLLVAIQRQVADAQAMVDEELGERPETTNRINEVHQALSLELKQLLGQIAGLQSRLAAVAEQRNQVLSDLRQLNGFEVEIEQLELEEQVARSKWLKYTDNLEQARIDQQREESRVSNVSIAQAATLARKPISPSKTLVGLGALLMATCGTVAVVLASERRRVDWLHNPWGDALEQAPAKSVASPAEASLAPEIPEAPTRPLTPK